MHIPPGSFQGKALLPSYGDCIGDVRVLRNNIFHPLDFYRWYCKSEPKVLELRTRPFIPLTLRVKSSRFLPDLRLFISHGPCPETNEVAVYCEHFISRHDALLSGSMTMDTILNLRAIPNDTLNLKLENAKQGANSQNYPLIIAQVDSMYLEVVYK